MSPGPLKGIHSDQITGPRQSTSGPNRLAGSQLGPPCLYPVAKSPDYRDYNDIEVSPGSYACHPSSPEAADPATVYATPGFVRQWQPSEVQLGHSASNVYNTPTSGDSSSAFPGAGALTSSFPPSLPATMPPSIVSERLLPDPRSTAIAQPALELPASSSQALSSENVIPMKSNIIWPERYDGLLTSTVTDAEASFKQALGPPNELKTPCGYSRACTRNAAQAVEHSTTSELALNPITTTISSLNEQMMPTSSSGTNSYTYSLQSGSKRPSACDNTLLNGQKYEPLPNQPSYENPQRYHRHYQHRSLQGKC